MVQPCSYSWLGPKGCGKRTKILEFLTKQAQNLHLSFEIKKGTWYLSKQTNNADPDEEDDESSGKSIPYEESALHLGFNIAHMSMSDKVFLQSILSRWTGQQDVCLMGSSMQTRYLVLYHAHFLTDESVLQLQECLEQYPGFAILLSTEVPLSSRLRDFCFEIAVKGEDYLLMNYTKKMKYENKDVWLDFFKKTVEDWSTNWTASKIGEIRNWIYICLQRNLRWTDVIGYWIEAMYGTEWITPIMKVKLFTILWKAESSAGYTLITSYRIPILWEHVHLKLARQLYTFRSEATGSEATGSEATGSEATESATTGSEQETTIAS
uniref:Uncharacterized protein n=1 Tax=viral metagenome TaxID=1070528 RepID=A0A6C0KM89_9ZZZZ